MNNLPRFLVIGAAKSGTTSLHQYLRQHPRISLPACKETNFFALDRSDPQAARYESIKLSNRIDDLAAYLAEFEERDAATTRGEVCPFYLVAPNAPANIHRYIPDARLIAILRNPIDRAFSCYNFENKTNRPSAGFDRLIQGHLTESSPISSTILEHGLYFKYLSRYYQLFPETQIQIVLYDQLQSDPQTLLANVLAFIGLPQFDFDTRGRFNRSGTARAGWLQRSLNRNKRLRVGLRRLFPARFYQFLRNRYEAWMFTQAEPMSKATRRLLLDYYRQDIENLQDLVHLDLSQWLSE